MNEGMSGFAMNGLAGKRLIDVSLPLGADTLVWPGDPPIEVIPRLRIANGDPANVSELRIGTHSGTHVDPPAHFVEGAAAIDEMPLERVSGHALVADLRDANGPIGPQDLEALGLPDGLRRLLLRTSNSELLRSLPVEFPETYAGLTPDAAKWIVERGLHLVGTDFLSIEERGASGHPVHHILLENDVVIVEGLNLLGAEPGEYTMMCLPLKVAHGDGGPARALLVER
jgi:arylformamidase